jgi:ribosomal RNA-processing protein 7
MGSPAAAPMIKGYLPIRLKIPTKDASDEAVQDETYFYIKEHQAGNAGDKKNNCTLFVANAPVVPSVRTKFLLKSIFGRYGDLDRVTVIPSPRQHKTESSASQQADSAAILSSWTNTFHQPSYLGPIHCEGKFAHVIFTSNKEMRRTLKALTQVMSDDASDNDLPGLVLDKIEIQTLADESARQYRQELRQADDSDGEDEDDDDDDDMDTNKHGKKLSGILKVAERYRASCSRLARAALLEECNNVMEDFEDAEEQDRIARDAASNEPDGDGFVTVSYSAQVGSKRELEQSTNSGGSEERRRKGQKRSRKKKENGAGSLEDFYRFQTKEHRKQSLQELRERFEEDLAKVKKMKEENQYHPF